VRMRMVLSWFSDIQRDRRLLGGRTPLPNADGALILGYSGDFRQTDRSRADP
jgi:hypothetical protein